MTSRTGALRSPLEALLDADGSLGRATRVEAAGRHGMWIATRSSIARVDLAGHPRLVRRLPAGSRVDDIVEGRHGDAWLTDISGSRILRVVGHRLEVVARLARRARPAGMALGPDGSPWFVESGVARIGRVTPRGAVQEFPAGRGDAQLIGIAAGPDRRMWFTDQRGRVGAVTAAGRVRSFSRGLRGANPVAIARGPDRALWFTDFRRHRIGRVSTAGTITTFHVREQPVAIASGPDGALWFTTAGGDSVRNVTGLGRITTSGRVTQYYVRHTCTAAPFGLASAPDGTLWFTEARGPASIGRFDPRAPTGTLAVGGG
jgi:virginiamycin B lyase